MKFTGSCDVVFENKLLFGVVINKLDGVSEVVAATLSFRLLFVVSNETEDEIKLDKNDVAKRLGEEDEEAVKSEEEDDDEIGFDWSVVDWLVFSVEIVGEFVDEEIFSLENLSEVVRFKSNSVVSEEEEFFKLFVVFSLTDDDVVDIRRSVVEPFDDALVVVSFDNVDFVDANDNVDPFVESRLEIVLFSIEILVVDELRRAEIVEVDNFSFKGEEDEILLEIVELEADNDSVDKLVKETTGDIVELRDSIVTVMWLEEICALVVKLLSLFKWDKVVGNFCSEVSDWFERVDNDWEIVWEDGKNPLVVILYVTFSFNFVVKKLSVLESLDKFVEGKKVVNTVAFSKENVAIDGVVKLFVRVDKLSVALFAEVVEWEASWAVDGIFEVKISVVLLNESVEIVVELLGLVVVGIIWLDEDWRKAVVAAEFKSVNFSVVWFNVVVIATEECNVELTAFSSLLVKLDWDIVGVVVERKRVDWLKDVVISSDLVVGNELFKVVLSNEDVDCSVWLVKFSEYVVGTVDSSFVV